MEERENRGDREKKINKWGVRADGEGKVKVI